MSNNEENPTRFVSIYEAVNEAIKDKSQIFNMKPEKSAVFTVRDFFNQEVKVTTSNHTKYAHVLCVFHEVDGEQLNGQIFYLQVTMLNGFTPLVHLLEQHKQSRVVTVKLIRKSKVIYYYEVMDTNKDMDMNIDIDMNRNMDTYMDSTAGVSVGVSEGVSVGVSKGVSKGVKED